MSTALHGAAVNGDVELVRRLLAEGADPNARDATERTPLHVVHLARNDERALEIAKLLVAAGADPRAKDGNRLMPSQLGYASDVATYLRKEARKKPKAGAKVAESPARASLKSDVERRIDDACRKLSRVSATHDQVQRRNNTLLSFHSGRLEFARIEREEDALEVRDGEGWRAIPLAEVQSMTDDELGKLVAESLTVARAPRVKVVTVVKVHPILKGALEKATAEERPEEPPHLGGETPVCPSREAALLTAWMAERAVEVSKPADADAARELIAMARASIDTPSPRARTGHGEEVNAAAGTPEHRYGALVAASRDTRGDSPALQIARRATGAAATLLKGKHDVMWVHAKAAAVRMLPILRAAGASVTELLRELDRRILVAEMVAAAARHAKTAAPLDVTRVLWRGPNLFLGQLADGQHALVGRLGKSWTLLTGTRDEMLASIPDFAFEAATRAVAEGYSGRAQRAATA
ncbi:MAG: ankyrin repeat domain-containing protein [Labilithrix sp.]|nr:ankyrin repeat domain-containing protein [Labilithrix sp.]MCW5812861.1 ankyrin repeat domain-containing protein [Labilithrix sp.]